MNRFEDAILKRLSRIIESKNSWGKNEILRVIGDLAVDQISQIKPVRQPIAPKPAAAPDDELPPF